MAVEMDAGVPLAGVARAVLYAAARGHPPPDVWAVVAPYADASHPDHPHALARLEPYQKVAAAQWMLAAPREMFSQGIPPEWLHPGALGHTTMAMPAVCDLPMERLPTA